MVKELVLSVKNLLNKCKVSVLIEKFAMHTFSQEGEDRILSRLFDQKSKGFYVDIGAHHPKRFSNTYLFYKRGWRGINIDAMPGSMYFFNKSRPRDTNLELGVAEESGKFDYYIFNEPALNGFSRDLSLERHEAESAFLIKDVIKVDVMPLCEVLDRYLPEGQGIDFMSVDVEGLDFQVLKSNDWNRYRPTYVLAEVLRSDLREVDQSEIGQLMRDKGYVLYAKCVNTVFFKESSSE